MSREISVYYQLEGNQVDIEILPPYYLFGSQRTSKDFWSLPIWHDINIFRLAKLGTIDPVVFAGWEEMGVLKQEIMQFQANFEKISFHSLNEQTRYLTHLLYNYYQLTIHCPLDAIPFFMIG